MAITFEEKRKGVNWFAIVVALVIAAVIALAVYFLFFVTPPGIEIVVPKQLESVIEISKIQFDPAAVVNSQAFRSLRSYVGLPSVGQLGRENPFISF